MSLPRSAGRVSLAAVALALIASLIVLIPVGTARAQDNLGELPTSCSYESARLLGWLWADGNYNPETDRFFFRTRSVRVAEHLEEILDQVDLVYLAGTSNLGHLTFSISAPGYDESLLTSDPIDDPLIACHIPSFLASLIEGEGSVDGKIFDDDLLVRRTIAAEVAAEVGLATNYLRNQVRIPPNLWPALETLPFVACGRVPGGTDHCILDQDPNGPFTQVLVEGGSAWRWQRGPQRKQWKNNGFDDSGWSIGDAELGFGQGTEATDVGIGEVTYYFRQEFEVDSPTPGLDLSILRDDGAVVYLNGVEVVRTNMPAGTVTAWTRASDYIGGDAEKQWHDFSVSGSALISGTNVIAVEVHQTALGSDDLSFDLTMSTLGSDGPSPVEDVLIYASSNYNGTSAGLSLGIHNAPSLGALNNDVQSIRVPDGVQVTMCTHAGGLGSCETLTADVSRLEKTYINKVSYFRVERRA